MVYKTSFLSYWILLASLRRKLENVVSGVCENRWALLASLSFIKKWSYDLLLKIFYRYSIFQVRYEI